MSTALALPTAADIALAPTREQVEATASHMAREYSEATAEIARLTHAMQEQCDRIAAAFPQNSGRGFRIGLEYNGHRYISTDEPERIFALMKREAWRILVDKLGVKNVMSLAKRNEFERQLDEGTLPDITEANILDILFGLADQARDFAQEAAKEVFDMLRPRGPIGGAYKTNDSFRVGRKVILPYRVERCWGGTQFRVNYHREQEITAVDGVFHLLDGKGVMRENKGPLFKAICACVDGRGETDYFRFKCFKNGNLHLEFKRLDLVRELNLLAVGERVLGDDVEV